MRRNNSEQYVKRRAVNGWAGKTRGKWSEASWPATRRAALLAAAVTPFAIGRARAAGGVLGQQIEPLVEDDASTKPGAVLAFSRLAENKETVRFIGSVRSTQMNAMAPDMLNVGKPVMFGSTDPTLTHQGNP